MPFTKVELFEEERPCRHPEHNPPALRLYPPGRYTYVCPACGKEQVLVVPHRPTLRLFEHRNPEVLQDLDNKVLLAKRNG